MAAFSWWRSWHGAPIDPKYAVIAARAGSKPCIVSAVMWALLDYASQQPNRGEIADFDIETYSVYAGIPEDEITAILKAMTDKGIIANGRLVNWEKRQPKREDDSKNRVTKFRDKKRSVTQGNAEVTNDSVSLSLSVKDEESEISKSFTSLTGILPYNLEQWVDAEQAMNRAGVQADELPVVLEKLKDMTVAGLWSITKTAIAVHADRKAGRPVNGKVGKRNPMAGKY